MGSHQISIREDIYRKLLSLQKENESFSDVIEDLLRHAKGSWGSLEKVSGVGGQDTLELELIVGENRIDLEKSFQKRLGAGGS